MGGGGRGSGRKKGSLGKKKEIKKEEMKQESVQVKIEPGTSSSSQVSKPVEVGSSEGDLFGDSLACSSRPKMGRSEGEGAQVVQFVTTPDSGCKKQLSIDSPFASPQEKKMRRGRSEEEMAILVVEEEVSRRE